MQYEESGQVPHALPTSGKDVGQGGRAARDSESAQDVRESQPVGWPARGDRYFATRLRQLARIDLEEAEAEALWREVARHRLELRRRLGRDVGQRVALLDFMVNVRREVEEPQIIEKTALEAIEHQAIADSLTGLYNRHYFEAVLAREAERSRRYGGPLSLLVLDLDRFKEINDQHGHPAGDRVLRKVATLVLNHVRASDVPCRVGGDEFAVILPDTPVKDAVVVAERIRTDIQSSFERDTVGGAFFKVTSSCGTATIVMATTSHDILIGEADRALYCAKAAGGNRVITAVARVDGGTSAEGDPVTPQAWRDGD